jgi:hypothetical protein
MYFSEDFLSKLAIVLAVWVVYLSFVAVLIKALNTGRNKKISQNMQMQQDSEKLKLEMRMNAEDYERAGRYVEAAILYEELDDLEKARKCQMLADYIIEFSKSEKRAHKRKGPM